MYVRASRAMLRRAQYYLGGQDKLIVPKLKAEYPAVNNVGVGINRLLGPRRRRPLKPKPKAEPDVGHVVTDEERFGPPLKARGRAQHGVAHEMTEAEYKAMWREWRRSQRGY